MPIVSVTGLLALGDGSNTGPSITGNWEIRDNVSFNEGAHSFKFGYNWRRHIEQYAFEGRSTFAFQSRYTGSAFADFLLGDAYSTSPGAEGLRGSGPDPPCFGGLDEAHNLDRWPGSKKGVDIGNPF